MPANEAVHTPARRGVRRIGRRLCAGRPALPVALPRASGTMNMMRHQVRGNLVPGHRASCPCREMKKRHEGKAGCLDQDGRTPIGSTQPQQLHVMACTLRGGPGRRPGRPVSLKRACRKGRDPATQRATQQLRPHRHGRWKCHSPATPMRRDAQRRHAQHKSAADSGTFSSQPDTSCMRHDGLGPRDGTAEAAAAP